MTRQFKEALLVLVEDPAPGLTYVTASSGRSADLHGHQALTFCRRHTHNIILNTKKNPLTDHQVLETETRNQPLKVRTRQTCRPEAKA